LVDRSVEWWEILRAAQRDNSKAVLRAIQWADCSAGPKVPHWVGSLAGD
jgi:hypothetical protein